MGITYKGWRKYLVILGFIGPTLLGILLISVFPIIYNIYVSFTNRNTYHYPVYEMPEADKAAFIAAHPVLGGFAWNVVCPVFPGFCCDPDVPGRMCVARPFYKNYVDMFTKLFTAEALLAFGKLLLIAAPLIAVGIAAKRIRERTLSPPPTWWWWIAGAAVTLGLWALLNGLETIKQLMNTGNFFTVMFRTVLYVVACIPLFFFTGLILALILNNEFLRGKAAFRVLLVIPWAVPSYVSALIWQFFFRTEQGTINQLLGIIGIPGPSWLLEPTLAFVAVVLVNLWMSYPFFMVTILGALQSIPRAQYEAAEMDGANWWHQLFHITLPLIRPAIMPAVVLSSITTFQMFNTVWLITSGGPIRGANVPGATEFVMIHAYKQIFQSQNHGYMGAFAMIVFVILFSATLYSMRMTRITKGAYE